LSQIDLGQGNVTLTLPGILSPAPVSISGINVRLSPDSHSTTLSGFCNNGIAFDKGDPLKFVKFHLVNFEEIVDQLVQDDDGTFRMARSTVKFDGWTLTIETVRDYSVLEKSLKAKRGYAITHIGRLERSDGVAFATKEVSPVLHALFWFFSFARGLESPPMLPVGFNSNGVVTWREWIGFRATAWRGTQGWLNGRQYTTSSLEESLIGFWKKWQDLKWNDPSNNNTPLILAIHWFLSANTDSGGVEGSIILAQTGLELVAWVRLVEDIALYGRNPFDALSAKDKFEALLNHVGLDTGIPPKLTHLSTLAVTKNWNNGPEAIAGYRNTLVHPKRRAANKDVVFAESYDILELALWYLELTLLYLFGYEGYYVSRATRSPSGDAELVPWSTRRTP
jgi:hypothetical protein